MVLTVPGTTSSSTYLMGLKVGSLVEVEAHSSRCGRAPRAASACHCGRGGDLLMNFIRAAGAGDRRLAAHGARRRLAVRGQRIEQLVDRRVDAAQEKARDRGDRGERPV